MTTPELRPDPVRYDPASPMRLLVFWRGCLKVREDMGDAAGAGRIRTIMQALDAGHDLLDIPEYARWLAHGG